MTEAGPRGLILAAGYGTRLAPVTDHLPKPLLPVDGEPLLDRIIAKLLQAGIAPVAVNSHHLGEQVQEHLAAHADNDRLVHFAEPDILGTGGALDNAREFLATTPYFVVHNGDVLCDVELADLLTTHRTSGALATLLLVDWPAVNSVTLGADGVVRHIAGTAAAPPPKPGDRHLTYTGIGVFDRALLDDIGPGFSSLIDPLVRALKQDPQAVRGHAPRNLAWDDLGTLARWLKVAGGDSRTGAGFSLQRITGHGSNRRFWRLRQRSWSTVAMISPPTDNEFERFLAVGRFLAAHDLGPPRLLAVDEPARTVLMEDLGHDSLQAVAMAPGTSLAALQTLYEQVVDRLLALQAVTPKAQAECPLAVDRTLDLDQLRWETTYFRERFLEGHLGLAAETLAPLKAEFTALALAVARAPLVLLHRDFQAQNILLQHKQVRLVDFQGLRLGPLTYDLASLVWDPYVDLPAALRQDLVSRFAAGCAEVPADVIRAMTVTAGLQRVMQALGAYGFLGRVKGKAEFLAHIPAGVDRLQRLLTELAQRQNQSKTSADYLPPPLPHLTRLVATLVWPDSGG